MKGSSNLTRALQILDLKSFSGKAAIRILNQDRACGTRFILVKGLLCSPKDAVEQRGRRRGVRADLGPRRAASSGAGVSATLSHLCWGGDDPPSSQELEAVGEVAFRFLFSQLIGSCCSVKGQVPLPEQEGRMDIRKEDHSGKTSNVPVAGFFLD